MKKNGVEVRFEPPPILTMQSKELTSTNWANQVHAIKRQFLYHFNDQLGEAWFCKSTRIDKITSIQRALNILKRALSHCQLSSKCLV